MSLCEISQTSANRLILRSKFAIAMVSDKVVIQALISATFLWTKNTNTRMAPYGRWHQNHEPWFDLKRPILSMFWLSKLQLLPTHRVWSFSGPWALIGSHHRLKFRQLKQSLAPLPSAMVTVLVELCCSAQQGCWMWMAADGSKKWISTRLLCDTFRVVGKWMGQAIQQAVNPENWSINLFEFPMLTCAVRTSWLKLDELYCGEGSQGFRQKGQLLVVLLGEFPCDVSINFCPCCPWWKLLQSAAGHADVFSFERDTGCGRCGIACGRVSTAFLEVVPFLRIFMKQIKGIKAHGLEWIEHFVFGVWQSKHRASPQFFSTADWPRLMIDLMKGTIFQQQPVQRASPESQHCHNAANSQICPLSRRWQ